MTNIIIHEKPGCPYCKKAIDLLNKYGYEYIREIYDPDSPNYLHCKSVLEKYSGRKTFPQIYVGKYHIGGYDDFKELSESEFRKIVENN